MATNKYGYTDRPEAVDQLGVGSYYEALADYIENCEAPTTISIQADKGGMSQCGRTLRCGWRR